MASIMTEHAPLDLSNRERVEIQVGGFGGQGIILAGNILGAAAAVHAGRNAVMSQTYGPESRGGACMAEVVIANEEIVYPRVVSPDVMAIMSQEAYTKYAVGRPSDCLLLRDEDLVTPDQEVEKGRVVLAVPATRLAEELGRRLVANIVMLGFVYGATEVMTEEVMREAVVASVPKGTEELNLNAFEAGRDHARKLRAGAEGAEE